MPPVSSLLLSSPLFSSLFHFLLNLAATSTEKSPGLQSGSASACFMHGSCMSAVAACRTGLPVEHLGLETGSMHSRSYSVGGRGLHRCLLSPLFSSLLLSSPLFFHFLLNLAATSTEKSPGLHSRTAAACFVLSSCMSSVVACRTGLQ